MLRASFENFISAFDNSLHVSEAPRGIRILLRDFPPLLVAGMRLFVGWRDTLGTAGLARFAISEGLIVGNSWSGQERSVIARCQMRKTEHSLSQLACPFQQIKPKLTHPSKSLR